MTHPMINWFVSIERVAVAIGLFALCAMAFNAQAQSAVTPAVSSTEVVPGGSPSGSALSSYRLAAGDVISVKVFNEPEFTQERIRLTDAGTMSFPVLGEIPVLGRTTGELEQLITQRLRGRILVNPQVTVWVEQYRPFFINGMVERPGAYPYLPGLTVRKAASIAGGFRERASMSKIFVQREQVRASDKGTRASLDTEIGPGDTITVEESFF